MMKLLKGIKTKAVLLAFMTVSIISAAPVFANTYTDTVGHKDEKYIAEYSSHNLVDGYPDGTFKPDNTITRAETVALLSKLELYAVGNKNVSFSDVDKASWYYKYVESAVKSGIVKGYEGNIFKPQNNITRFEAFSILSNFVRSESYNSVQLKFSNSNSIPTWVNSAIRNLTASGVIENTSDTINGNEYITRSEMIRMLDKVMQIYNFDISKVSSTALENASNPLATITEIPHDILGYLTVKSVDIVNYPVKDGADLATIKTALGHFSETPLWDGNVSICAHNRDYKYDFRNLKKVKTNDEIIYKTRFGERTYVVTEIKSVNETDWNDILYSSDKNTITLLTCIEEQPTKRLIVRAVQK